MILLVHDLRREGAGIEVRYETTNLAAIDLKDAHAVVDDSVAVRGTLRGPLERRTLLGGENVSEGGLHLAEGLAVLGPESAQALVTPEGLRHRDVAHLTVVGVDFDQGLDVPVLLQLPQSLDEVVRHLLGHILGPFSSWPRPPRERPFVDRGSELTTSEGRAPNSCTSSATWSLQGLSWVPDLGA